MCAIAGEMSFGDAPPDPKMVERMTGTLVHRGPDDAGFYSDAAIALGSRRLSILDLTAAGHMPMVDEATGLVLVYNGEIYNSPELRKELEGRGERFRSRSDTEVLLKLLAREGPPALKRLRGMFAFACWDSKNRMLLVARDEYGIKPLYFHRSHERFLFASEPKALLEHPAVGRRLSPAGIVDWFTIGATIAPRTMWDRVEKLAPGTYMALFVGGGAFAGPLARGGRFGEPVPIVDPLERVPRRGLEVNEDDLRRALVTALTDSARAHLLSDVPVGVFLSGGIDSAAVVAGLRRAGQEEIRTFSVGFRGPEELNELGAARITAGHFGTKHLELLLGAEEIARDLVPLTRMLDEPPGDPAIFPTHALAREAAKSVKVVLSGEGGDELFGGYRRYAADRHAWWYRGPVRGLVNLTLPDWDKAEPSSNRTTRALRALSTNDPAERGMAFQWIFSPEQITRLVRPEWRGDVRAPIESYRAIHAPLVAHTDRISALLQVDRMLRLSDGFLEKLDRATMAAGIEGRVPLLDPALASVAAHVPGRMMVSGSRLKHFFRGALKGVVPEEIRRGAKRGFTLPLSEWFRGGLRPLLKEVVRPDRIAKRGILEAREVEALLAREPEVTQQLWQVFAFELWCREHLDGGGA